MMATQDVLALPNMIMNVMSRGACELAFLAIACPTPEEWATTTKGILGLLSGLVVGFITYIVANRSQPVAVVIPKTEEEKKE